MATPPIDLEGLRDALGVVAAEHWRPQRERLGVSAPRWLPIAQAVSKVSGAITEVGLGQDGSWWAETAHARIEVRVGQALPALLCWLEYERGEVLALLSAGLERHGLPTAAALMFPFSALAAYGLRSTEHWTHLALDWLEDGLPPSPVSAEALGELIRNPLLEPDTRRRAARLAMQAGASSH